MEYSEYKKILDEGMVEYVNGGGSIYHMSKALKEYIFHMTMNQWQPTINDTYQIKRYKLS